MHELSDVPENALGKIQPISNTSAAALTITYYPLIQQANIKAIQYGQGIQEINLMMLRELEIMEPDNERLRAILEENENFLYECQIDPVFAYGFPKDKNEELQRAQMELSMKLNSRRNIMDRMGMQNVNELLDEIDEDTIRQAQVQMQINEMVNQSGLEGMLGGQGNEEEGNEETSNTEEPEDNNLEEPEGLTEED